MSVDNGRIGTDASDYFGGQKKTAEFEKRRPVPRRASDLVGPGINSSATRVTDWSDTLATFNGYFASVPGALNAPNATEPFTGYTVMDAEFGGTQTLTGMTSAQEYKRMFRRKPGDAETVDFDVWKSGGGSAAASAISIPNYDQPGNSFTLVPANAEVVLHPPNLEFTGGTDTFIREEGGLRVMKPGVYTGNIHLVDVYSYIYPCLLQLHTPNGVGRRLHTYDGLTMYPGVHIPFMFANARPDSLLEFKAVHNETDYDVVLWWDILQIARLGDA